jgi:Predicted hydrolases or acyltransferases (alpha/beta hydrolase superfamily)
METFKTGTVQANGIQFHFLEAGEGPLALCLHGFPDSPWSYRYLLPELANAGYRAVAPFMRGYAPTEVPADGRYSTSTLADDVIGLHKALGGDGKAVLIAHDWGSVAAFGGAAKAPQAWRRCAIMGVPPFAIFGQVAFSYEQIKRSFYFWFFQMQISDAIVPGNDLAFIDGLWADWSPGYDAKEDLPRVKECLRKPENLKAAMGYYRALFDPAHFGAPAGMEEQGTAWGRPIPQPTLYLHGTKDGCIALDAEAAKGIPAFLGAGSEVERVEGVGHFMLVEKPTQINERILRFLSRA